MTGSDLAASGDPLLTALRIARRRKQQAEQDLRLLLAYAREFTRPRPYRLADLAEAAGMSISGVRIAYGPRDIAQVAGLLEQAAERAAAPDA